MKKRTKISLRTKIYLTIVGLLAMAGIIYAATPVTFSTFQSLTGVAVSKTEFFTTGYAPPNVDIYTLNCAGMPTTYAASAAAEKYIAIAPAQAGFPNNTFTPRDVFVTYANQIYRATPPGPFAFFAAITCSEPDHTGITFDKVGTFGNDMIVTCKDGGVFRINGAGAVTQIASGVGAEAEGPVVAPVAFGTFGGGFAIDVIRLRAPIAW